MRAKSEYPTQHADQHLPSGSDPVLGEHALNVLIDGFGNPITTGIKGDVLIERKHRIAAWSLFADATATVVVDIWKAPTADFPPDDTDSITAGNEPALAGQVFARDTTLTGWTTIVDAGDVLRFNVDSAAAATQLTLTLTLTPVLPSS